MGRRQRQEEARQKDLQNWGKKGPNGRGLCRQCEKEVPKGRRTFCGQPCIDEWRLRTDAQFLREKVYERDCGVCAGCKVDTKMVHVEFENAHWMAALDKEFPGHPEKHPYMSKVAEKYGLKPADRWKTKWQADHIVELADGGGWGLDNVQSLCLSCHRKKSAQSQKARAATRRAEKLAGGK